MILGLLLASCVYGYRDLLELVAVYGESRCRNLVTQLVLDAAAETKTAEKLSSFTTVENKSLVTLDSNAVRSYQAAVGKCLSQKLDGLEEQAYPVPIGTVIGGVLLMERGPLIEIRFIPVGSARVSVDSTLQQAGVNQVLYRVVLELSVDMTVVLPGGTRAVSCDQQVVLEEVLLTGQVPMLYGG
ncbi:MAG: sporulation protein YunB [Clostridia bacterium]|nr:sporulation protein YunB [Clostridia bacterium]